MEGRSYRWRAEQRLCTSDTKNTVLNVIRLLQHGDDTNVILIVTVVCSITMRGGTVTDWSNDRLTALGSKPINYYGH